MRRPPWPSSPHDAAPFRSTPDEDWMTDIAVVGMACRFPHAPDVPGLWRVVRDGVVTFSDIPADRWNHATFFEPNDLRATDKTYVSKGAFLDDVKEFGALHY